TKRLNIGHLTLNCFVFLLLFSFCHLDLRGKLKIARLINGYHTINHKEDRVLDIWHVHLEFSIIFIEEPGEVIHYGAYYAKELDLGNRVLYFDNPIQLNIEKAERISISGIAAKD